MRARSKSDAGERGGPGTLVVLLDNSAAMRERGQNGKTLWEQQLEALDLLVACNEAEFSQFSLVTMAGEAETPIVEVGP